MDEPKRYSPPVVDGALASALRWLEDVGQWPSVDLVLAAEVLALRKTLGRARELVASWSAMAEKQRHLAREWRERAAALTPEGGAPFEEHAARCDAAAAILETQTVILKFVLRDRDDEPGTITSGETAPDGTRG